MVSAELSWIIGVSLAVSANIVSNIGLNVQKRAHSSRQEKSKSLKREQLQHTGHQPSISAVMGVDIPEEDGDQASYVFDAVWLIGLLLQVVGAIFDFVALGFAPQSVVAPLGSLTLVVNVCMAPIMQNEQPSRRTIVATFIIITGCIITVVFSSKEDDLREVRDVFGMYRTIEFLSYGVLISGFMLTLWLITQFTVRLSRTDRKLYQRYFKVHQFATSALSGTMGAQNILFAKGASTLLVLTISGDGMMFVHFETYLILIGLFTSIYFQLRWLNSGLKRFSALQVVPIFQSFWILVSVLGGLAVYQEFDNMTFVTKMVFPFGVVMTVGGVTYLTTQGQPKKYKLSKKPSIAKPKLSQKVSGVDTGQVAESSSTVKITTPSHHKPYTNGDVELQNNPNISPFIMPTSDDNEILSTQQTTIENMEIDEKAQSNADQDPYKTKPESPSANSNEEKITENDPNETKLEDGEISRPKLRSNTTFPTRIAGLSLSKHIPAISERMTLALPTPRQIIAKTYEYGEAAVVTGSSLGRLLIQQEELLKDSDLGVEGEELEERVDDEETTIQEQDNNDMKIEEPAPERKVIHRRHSTHSIFSRSNKSERSSHIRSMSTYASAPQKANHEIWWENLVNVFRFKKGNGANELEEVSKPETVNKQLVAYDDANFSLEPLSTQQSAPELADTLILASTAGSKETEPTIISVSAVDSNTKEENKPTISPEISSPNLISLTITQDNNKQTSNSQS